MEDPSQQQDGSTSTSLGERPVVPDNNSAEQPLSPKDERIVSANPYPDAAITGPPSLVTNQLEASNSSGAFTPIFPLNAYSPSEQSFYYGGYDNSTGQWGDFSNYVNANNLQIVPPAMYNDNYRSSYGFDAQMAYGQFSPLATPMSPIMLDGQLYSPHQFPMSSPPYYTRPVSPSIPHVTSSLSISQSDHMTPRSNGQEGLGSGYYLHFGSFDGNPSGSSSSSHGFYKYPGEIGSREALASRSNPSDMGSYYSPMTSGAIYPQPVDMFGSYEQNFRQASRQHTPVHGFGSLSNSSTRRYPHSGSYRYSNYGSANISRWEANRERERRDMIVISNDSHSVYGDRNRGPRASKPKGKNTNEEISATNVSKNGASTSGVALDLYNRPDFVTDYENAKFFVIKSFSEDNVHKSIKYGVWASTPLGNRKLDAAYHEAKEAKGDCPIFLFFSVNASGQFCGVAEMVGSVDFENDANYWQQDRWSGQFPVKWHIIKDVPNTLFRHILLESNDNKPVTHSRDSQEVKLELGIEMLKIFKEHDADTSMLDDFNYYDEREKVLHEKKAKQLLTSSTKNASVDTSSINQSDNLVETLRLESRKEVHKTE